MLSFVPYVRSQSDYDAWFTHIYVTDGNSQIDLIDGGTAKVYRGQEAVMRLTVYNNRDYSDYLYINIYRNGELIVRDSGFSVEPRSSHTEEFSASAWGPTTHSYKVELFYYYWFTAYVIDAKEFEVKVVKLTVSGWSHSTLSIERGFFGTADLTVTFTNGGNDYMYSVSVSVVDSAGLTVTPQTQDLGNINEQATKSAIFSVQAGGDKTPNDYTITFQVAYNDLRGVKHTETFQADVTVKLSNFIMENLGSLILIFVVIGICLVVPIYFLKLRKPKQIKTRN